MNLVKKLSKLVKNDKLNDVMLEINNERYSRLSFNEKSNLFMSFNDALNKSFNHKLFLYINKETSKDYEPRSVNVNDSDSRMVINGICKNPYIYLRDILFIHMSYTDIENYDEIRIGRVKYEENFTYSYPQLAMYNKWNIRFLKGANKFIYHFLNESNNGYKKEFLKDFDCLYTEEAINEIQNGYNAFDCCLKRGVYEEMGEIFNTLSEMIEKDRLTPNELSWLSLDDVALCYIFQEGEVENSRANDHYKQFIEYYFKDYAKYIDIEIDEFGLSINGRELSDDDMFLDVLLQVIFKIENRYNIIDNIVSDEELERFNKIVNKNYTKLDCYFYSRLDIIDSYLENKHLEIINYNKWTNIYKDDVKKSIFIDKREIFKELLDNQEFINVVENFLVSKDKNYKPLYKIMDMLNATYGHKFNLIVKEDTQSDSSFGLADHECIYLNADTIDDKTSLLITLFHEYRHLIQRKEININTGLYDKTLYEYIKLGNEESVCDNNYGYADIERFGYINDMFYQMQPSEYDAELFAERFTKSIVKRMKKSIKIDYKSHVSNNYRRCKFIDSEKLSIESYKNYLIVNEIYQAIKEENDNYKDIMHRIEQVNNKNDAIKIIKEPFFMSLGSKDKIKVYQIIAKGYASIDYDKSQNIVIINDKKYRTTSINDYQIIEKLVVFEIDKKIREGKIKFINRNKLIYDELLKYKPLRIEEYNCFTPYAYHSCIDKYYRASVNINNNNQRKSK